MGRWGGGGLGGWGGIFSKTYACDLKCYRRFDIFMSTVSISSGTLIQGPWLLKLLSCACAMPDYPRRRETEILVSEPTRLAAIPAAQ